MFPVIFPASSSWVSILGWILTLVLMLRAMEFACLLRSWQGSDLQSDRCSCKKSVRAEIPGLQVPTPSGCQTDKMIKSVPTYPIL